MPLNVPIIAFSVSTNGPIHRPIFGEITMLYTESLEIYLH